MKMKKNTLKWEYDLTLKIMEMSWVIFIKLEIEH